MKSAKILTAALTAALLLCGCGGNAKRPNTPTIQYETVNAVPELEPLGLSDLSTLTPSADLGLSVTESLKRAYKNVGDTNPIASNIFFADPTAVEYNGRLYVYGTCDTQQYRANGEKGDNGYGNIASLSCFSTDDMKNWTYHGDIKTTYICSWAGCSWAPSIVSRATESGETEFFLYFCNSGGGIGVMKSNSPLGPWEDPVGHALLPHDNKDLQKDPVCWCFDPGVVIDDNGVGWLAFGGGDPMHPGESGLYTGNSRIVRLGEDMISVDSEVVVLPTPYHFEANELNYINGKYILTYCSNWKDRSEWPSEYDPIPRPDQCTMCYMVSDDPLDPDSWEYKGQYLKNPTSFGLAFSNNHSHLQKFGDKYYLFYQNVNLLSAMNKPDASGYRSIGVDELKVDEKKGEYGEGTMTNEGVKQLKNLDPFKTNEAETANTTAGIEYKRKDGRQVAIGSGGSWTCVTGVDFKDGANLFAATVKGKGVIEIRIDDKSNPASGAIQFDSAEDYATVYTELSEAINGVHDVYFVYGGEETYMDNWQFGNK